MVASPPAQPVDTGRRVVEAAQQIRARQVQPPAGIRLPVAAAQVVMGDPAGLARQPNGQDVQGYVQNGTIYSPKGAPLSPTRNRDTYWHEKGHVLDGQMSDAMRRVIARDIFGQDVSQWNDTADQAKGITPGRELFADAYAGLMQNKPGHWDPAYQNGYVGAYPGKGTPIAKMEQLRQILSTLAQAPDPSRQGGLTAIARSLRK